jgi:hypothetical protein
LDLFGPFCDAALEARDWVPVISATALPISVHCVPSKLFIILVVYSRPGNEVPGTHWFDKLFLKQTLTNINVQQISLLKSI